jgi:hypothetical protein
MNIVKLLFAIVLAASIAAAQNKVSGTAQCPGKPGESHSIEVGDHPGHSYNVAKGECTWTKPLEIAGLKTTGDSAADFMEVDGNRAREHSFRVETTDGGDKYYVRTQGTDTMKDQKLESGQGTWSFAGGTGKLKGIKGKGTYKCMPSGDNVDCDVEGEYTLPAK